MSKSQLLDHELKNASGQYDAIYIKGARSNNLKNIDVVLPKNKLIVIAGVSGSGKSSLTMDTLFAEGQRRYVESLSSYARQFLMRMKKPEVDFIKGICPAIAIEQKTGSKNPRSTVGTLTEIYDFLRLLYARVGKMYSPISGNMVKRHEVTDVANFIHEQEEGDKIQLFTPLLSKYADRTIAQELNLLLQKGYTRIQKEGELTYIEDVIEENSDWLNQKLNTIDPQTIYLLIDRFAVKHQDEEHKMRINDSIQTAFYESEGQAIVLLQDGNYHTFNNRFELDGIVFPEIKPQLFNFNNPYGACPVCEGYSKTMGIDANKVIPDPSKSIYEGAIACWKGEKFGWWLQQFIKVAHHMDFPVHQPWEELSEEHQKLMWTGNKLFLGINAFFDELQEKTYKIQNRIMIARYRGKTDCYACGGGRLRKEALYVRINDKNIAQLTRLPIDELKAFFDNIELSKQDSSIAKRLLIEINQRLQFMHDVGLSYLTLDRLAATLSGGETQRINLTRTLGSNLTNSLYILDEPSVGLHPRDTNRLVAILKRLRDLGNTVIVVEHEEEVIKNADYLIDVGPKAGIHGGNIVYADHYSQIATATDTSLTAAYMTGTKNIEIPTNKRQSADFIAIKGARENNLKKIDVQIPLQSFTVVSGVSGSGKTTLIKQILYPAICAELGIHTRNSAGRYDDIQFPKKLISHVEMVDQNPLGKSSRSNPVTYLKAYDDIRKLMADQQIAKIRGYKPGHFSFNVEGGRCPSCKGDGEQLIEMQFLADIKLTCEECGGKRFKKEILEVKFKGKSIHQILEMSIEEALEFFADYKKIYNKIKPLDDVGLGYVQLGQSSSTLSGGEAQRVKLASFLTKQSKSEKILFIFDEPTTGLHFDDINKLLKAMNALVENGHSVIVIEHNLEVIKSADWLIDLGPEGGKEGGNLLFQGPVEEIHKVEASHTAKYLMDKL